MRLEHSQIVLQGAAEDSLRRIREDQTRVSPKIQPLLAYVADNLFDPRLNVNELKRACKVRDNSTAVRFHAEVGQPPGAYITARRLETAATLLRDSRLPVWQIAELVGYSTLQVFSGAFQRWSGERPTVYRRRMRAAASKSSQSDGVHALREAMRGQLERPKAHAIIHQLQDLYTCETLERPIPTAETPRFSAQALERLRCEEVWNSIRNLPRAAQRESVQRLRFSTPQLFDLLCTKSRQEGRADSSRRLHLAELALLSLQSLDTDFDPIQRQHLLAQAWARVGNARRLAVDLAGAFEALNAAEIHLPASVRDRRVLAEICDYRASLLWYQRSFQDALAVQNRAVALWRSDASPGPLAGSLVMRAVLFEYLENFSAGIQDLQEAIRLLEAADTPFIQLSALLNLVTLSIKAGQHSDAHRLLPRAEAIADRLEHNRARLHIQWLDGVIHHQSGRLDRAERLLRQAQRGFVEIDDGPRTAAVTLDLGLCCLEQGRPSETLMLVSEIIPIFDALPVQADATTARRLLHEAVASSRVTRSALEQVKNLLEGLRHDPATYSQGQTAQTPLIS